MIFLALIIAAAVVYFFYRKTLPQLEPGRRWFLLILRFVSISIVLILLMNPIIYFVKATLLKPTIIFLEDTSDSMNETSEGISKIEYLNNIKDNISTQLENLGYQTETYRFANGLDGSPNVTHISKTLKELNESRDLSFTDEIILVSDGWFSDEDLDVIDGLNIPISSIVTDFSNVNQDVSAEFLKINKTGFVDENIPAIATLKATNYSDSSQVNLYVDDRLYATKSINFSDNSTQKIAFEPHFSEVGLHRVKVEITSPFETENNLSNNEYSSTINITVKEKNILVISDFLTWDVKFLLDAVNTQEGWNSTYINKQESLQIKEQKIKLENYLPTANLLVLVSTSKLEFSPEDAMLIKQFLQQGGGLLLMGENIEALDEITPSTSVGIDKSFIASLRFTNESRKYESLNISSDDAKEIPPVDYFYIEPKLQAEVLARFVNDESSAAITFQRFDKGKVLHCSFLNLWKWQLWSESGNYYNFITDLVRWLSQLESDQYYVTTNKSGYFEGESIEFKLDAFDEKMQPLANLNNKLIVKKEGKVVREDFLLEETSNYTFTLDYLPAGRYSYHVSEAEYQLSTDGHFDVIDQSNESRDNGFNYPLLQYFADNTMGRIYDDASEIDRPNAKAVKRTHKNELPLYRKWYILVIFLLTFCIELYCRIRWGLL